MTALDQLRPLVGVKQACPSTVSSARHLVPASETPSLSLACGRTAAFTSGAFRKRTVRRAGVSS
jgi:hypothetical protein